LALLIALLNAFDNSVLSSPSIGFLFVAACVPEVSVIPASFLARHLELVTLVVAAVFAVLLSLLVALPTS